jgi:hypothetical protein
MVRIHFPPAASLLTIGSAAGEEGFLGFWAASVDSTTTPSTLCAGPRDGGSTVGMRNRPTRRARPTRTIAGATPPRARHHDLDVGDERVAGHPGQFRIGQAQNPAFGLLGADQLGRPHRLGRRSRHRHRWGTASLRGSMDRAAA